MAASVSRRPSRQCGSSGASGLSLRSTEYAGREAGRPSSAVDAAHVAAQPGLVEDRLGEVGPRAIAVGGNVPDAVRLLEQLACRGGEVADERRRASLVVDDGYLVQLR